MTMTISPISALSASGISPAMSRPTATPKPETGGQSFGDIITKAVDNLTASHAEADRLSVQAATGDLTAVHDYTIAATEAQLLTQLTVEVRNRAIESFNDIMRMQV